MRRALALFLLLVFPSALLGQVLCSTEMAAGHDHGAEAMTSVHEMDHGEHAHGGAPDSTEEVQSDAEGESSHPPVCLTLLTCGGGAMTPLGLESFLPELGSEASPLHPAIHQAPAPTAFEPPPPRS